MSCDYAVAARIIASDGATEVIDFNDQALGLDVEQIVPPGKSRKSVRVAAPRVDGSFPVAFANDDGDLLMSVHVHGDTWAECETRWEVADAACEAEPVFYLETEIEGVTRRYLAEWPDIDPQAITSTEIGGHFLTYVLRFRVQPNPTFGVAP